MSVPKAVIFSGQNPNEELRIELTGHSGLRFVIKLQGTICEFDFSLFQLAQAVKTITDKKKYEAFFGPSESDPENQIDDIHSQYFSNFMEWQKCEWKAFPGVNMPDIGRPVVIRLVLASKVDHFLAVYAGDGQFRIETKAELLDDGSHRKLTASCGAHVVTHWSYLKNPKE